MLQIKLLRGLVHEILSSQKGCQKRNYDQRHLYKETGAFQSLEAGSSIEGLFIISFPSACETTQGGEKERWFQRVFHSEETDELETVSHKMKFPTRRLLPCRPVYVNFAYT